MANALDGHGKVCKANKQIYLVAMEEEDGGEEEEEEYESPEGEVEYTTPPDSPKGKNKNRGEPEIAMHAISNGEKGATTLTLKVRMGQVTASALVDSGSTTTFISPALVRRAKLEIKNCESIPVRVANREFLYTGAQCHQQVYSIQGEQFVTTFRVLEMKGYDIIFGCDWIRQYSPVSLNLKTKEMTVNKGGSVVVLSDVTVPARNFMISMHKMEKWIDQGMAGAVLYMKSVQKEKEGHGTLESIEKVLANFEDVFEEPKMLPPTRDCDHTIPLVPGAKPVNVRPYRLPHNQKNAMEELVKQLISSNTIKPSMSPYSSPAILVKKKDGSWRMCIDYRQLNSNTIKNKYPIPVIEDLLDELHGSKYFSKIDLRSGYHQIRMDVKDVPKTSFSTHMGHFEFVVMPFGLTNAPATFQVLMNRILAEHLRKFVLVFFDDILIYSKTLQEHVEHVSKAMEILRTNQLFAKRSKCVFGQRQVEYLGYVISDAGVATDPEKIRAVREWPTPTNITELRGFLGLAGYYRRFIQNFGVICRPMFDSLKKMGFKWEEKQQQSFDEIKSRLAQAPVLALLDFTQPFILEADASGSGIGAVLMQGGRLIAYISKAIGPRAAGYSTYDKEALAILEALKKWKHYFMGTSVIIRTDQASLRYINE